MAEELVSSFQALTRKQILALPTGKFGDYKLLSVCESFNEINDQDREMAVYELILRSPEVDEMVAYDELYFELVNYYRWKKNFRNAVQWCYSMISFCEQHDEGINRINHRIDLANICLGKEDFNIGLGMYTRMLKDTPRHVRLYNNLGLELPRLGLSSLAVEVLKQGLKLVKQKDQYRLKAQFKDLRDEAVELASKETSRTAEIDPVVLADFQEALRLPVKATAEDDDNATYPHQIERLWETGEAAYDEIIAAGQLFIPVLIQLAYDLDNTNGSAHAISVLQILCERYPEELAMLAPWLDQAEENWQLELLSTRMGKVGGYTTQALQAYAADTICDTSIRSSATDALVERVHRFPELRDETIAFFRTLFTRPEAYDASEEQFIARLISNCLDLDARELYPEIKQVYEEDRLESGWVNLEDVRWKWVLADAPSQRRTDGLYLPLICKKCGRKRTHFTEYVLVDINSLRDDQPKSKYASHILDHEVICPKCGAVDRYKITPEAHLRMAGPDAILSIMQSKTGQKPKKGRSNPRVLYFRSAVFGKTMHPLDGLDEYRRRIARNPHDALLHSKMGSLLRTLMRYSDALEAQRLAYRLAPDDPEVIIRLAFSEHDFGDREAARRLYRNVIDLASSKKIWRQVDENTVAAVEGLRNLKRNKPSATEIILHTRDGKPVEHPYRSWRKSQSHPGKKTPGPPKPKRRRRRKKKK